MTSRMPRLYFLSRRTWQRLLAWEKYSDVGGVFPQIKRSVRGVTHRLGDSFRLSTRPDSALTVCSSTRRHCHHPRIVFELVTGFRAGSSVYQCWFNCKQTLSQLLMKTDSTVYQSRSTVDENRLNCLRTLSQLFINTDSNVYQSRLQCSPTLGQLFTNGHSTVYQSRLDCSQSRSTVYGR